MTGNITEFDLRGRAAGTNIVARGNAVRAFKSDYAWSRARAPQSKLSLAVDADEVSAMGFAFDTVNARVTYASSGGHVELAITQGNVRQYGLTGDYDFDRDRKELRLADLRFRLDTALWTMPHSGAIQWGGQEFKSRI